MLLYVSILNEKIDLDLNQDFDRLPVDEARKMITSRQAEVLKSLMAKKVLNTNSDLNLDIKEYRPGSIELPTVTFVAQVKEPASADVGRYIVVTISPDGDTSFNYTGVIHTARYHRDLKRNLDRVLSNLFSLYGEVKYSHH